MADDDCRLPTWAVALVFALAMVAGAALALLVWMIVFVIPALRAAAGGLS